ncbi:MAG: hypothetical protein IJ876_02755 [Elusimicrobiaceae bacterium]|nr:hypothetical protein [Elusimicrobiaceae bacterium]
MHKRWLIFCLVLFTAAICSAQTPFASTIERTITRQTLTLPALSQRINQTAYKQIAGIFRPSPLTQLQRPLAGFTPEMRRQVFQVQSGPVARSSASAFALEIDGRVWGVTAGHVMNNIRISPHMVVQNGWGKILSAPIAQYYAANVKGSDVAIFEIPQELKPYISVLKPAEQTPLAQTVTQSPCFVKGNPLYLPAEDILFAGPHRILLRDQAHREMTGYCGSPVLADNKVIGVHVGAYSSQDMQLAAWNKLLGNISAKMPPPVHIATPIEQVVLLARDFTKELGEEAGVLLKVLGHPVVVLDPQDQLFSVQQLRDGFLKETIHIHPFTHFDRLEEFFDLQEGDILRITIISPKTLAQSQAIKIYNVDVSTGQVTKNL